MPERPPALSGQTNDSPRPQKILRAPAAPDARQDIFALAAALKRTSLSVSLLCNTGPLRRFRKTARKKFAVFGYPNHARHPKSGVLLTAPVLAGHP